MAKLPGGVTLWMAMGLSHLQVGLRSLLSDAPRHLHYSRASAKHRAPLFPLTSTSDRFINSIGGSRKTETSNLLVRVTAIYTHHF